MKFKLDENTPLVLKKVIEAAGSHTVDSVQHEHLRGIDDHDLLVHCLKEERILITLDTEFLNQILHPKGSFWGIIVLRPSTQGKYAVKRLFEYFLRNYQLEDTEDKVVIVETTIIRIRSDQ